MNNSFQEYRRLYFRISDLAAINLAFGVGLVGRFRGDAWNIFTDYGYLSLWLFFILAWFIVTQAIGAYTITVLSFRKWRKVVTLVQIIGLHLLLTVAFNGLIKTYFSRLFLLYTYGTMAVLLPLFRHMVLLRIRKMQRTLGESNRVAIIGSGELMDELEIYLSEDVSEKMELEIIRFKTDHATEVIPLIEKALNGPRLSELFVAASLVTSEKASSIVQKCEDKLVRVRLVLDYPRINLRPLQLLKYEQVPVIPIPSSPLDDPLNRLFKRLFDILFSSLVTLFILSWLIPLMAIFIKLSSKGPVFFVQKRSGYNNVHFNCYKLRTMHVNADADRIQATANDSRIFPLGQFLRTASIDELPQFINVLKGQMSVVGPRPHMVTHTLAYTEQESSFLQRHAIIPGITGLAQAKGFRGEISQRSQLKARLRYDRFYVENWSLWLDIKIIVLTLLSAFRRHA